MWLYGANPLCLRCPCWEERVWRVCVGFGGCRGQNPEPEAAAMPGKDYRARPAPLPRPLSVNYLSEDYIMQMCSSELSKGFKKKLKEG